MFKKVLSIVLSMLCAAAVFPLGCSSAAVPQMTVTMGSVPIEESKPGSGKYVYKTPSLQDIPILSAECDTAFSDMYDITVTQPDRQNGYVGDICIISKTDGTAEHRTVRVVTDGAFKSHFINKGGDPWVTFHDGWYYYMVTGNGFYISKSRDLSRVNSNPVSVFSLSKMTDMLLDSNGKMNIKELWAPELHFYDGYWYIYYTVYDGNTAAQAKNHRTYVIKSDTDDAQGSYTYMGQLKEVEEDYINEPEYADESTDFKPGHFAIDQTFFTYNGKLYTAWSGWSGYTNICQRIYIAEMSDPCTISSQRTELASPQYNFESYYTSPAVCEGPQALISPSGVLNLVYSANSFISPYYSLGLLTLKEGGNPLVKEDWIKSDSPVFEKNEEESTYSVGHCSFVPSPDMSENYIIYHARRGIDADTSPREIRTQPFSWYDDGTPNFGKAVSADELINLPSGTALPCRISVEAEEMELYGTAAAVSEEDKNITTYEADYYSGSSRVKMTSATAQAAFTVNVQKAGLYTVSLLAAGGSSSGLAVTVNGTEKKTAIAGNSYDINNFFYYDIKDFCFSEGENTVTVSYTSDYKNGAYLDMVSIINQEDEAAAWAAQDIENAACTKTPVVNPKPLAPEYYSPPCGQTVHFTDNGDFDKYWFSSLPFSVNYPDSIISCRPRGHKRLLVHDKRFDNLADFTASVAITPSAAHVDDGANVGEETKVRSGIIFRVSDMGEGSVSDYAFNGYRIIFLVASDGTLKMQAHIFKYNTASPAAASGTVIATSAKGLKYTPGDTYIMEVTAEGDMLNAVGYNQNDPETVIKIENKSLTSEGICYDSGRIGLYSDPTQRVLFADLAVTPAESPASNVSRYGNLAQLSSFDSYTVQKRTFTAKSGIISVPSGAAKLLLSDRSAQNISDFDASVRIKLKSTSQLIQTGIAFRVQDAVNNATPGITGYVLALQRVAGTDINSVVINLTKYGIKGSSANQNLGSQIVTDVNLLSDITSKSDITDREFILNVSVRGNIMRVNICRADNPSLASDEIVWELDDPDFNFNANYPCYYESGRIGIFSNALVEISYLNIQEPAAPDCKVNTADNPNATVYTSALTARPSETVSVTATAKSGYYITDITAEGYGSIPFVKSDWDSAAVHSLTAVPGDVNITAEVRPITAGDANGDGATDILDMVRLKKYLSGGAQLKALSNSDICADRSINSQDLVGLKRLLLSF